jgi:ketosteroid isomerase-like protein
MATVAVDVEAAAVAETIQRYIEAVEELDLAKYATVVAHDGDLAWYGSMPGQIVGWGEIEGVIRGMFDALSDIRITQTDLRIHFSPDRRLAWATCLWDFRARMGDEPVIEPTRCTWVLERRGTDWVIVHWHKSVGVPD